MYIKSLILDGFKSYGNRVEVCDFDPEFNAITGLNGTGKSNILDAICFVLGITNLSHVRAGSLQDLIYKSGQCGVVKATVSITFDNRDTRSSPPGFESFEEITISRQVVMGGKNKYMINGSVVTNKRVQDIFCSIQLNVNNPHFLIMQGRVTKVINMKPVEILSMLEEAAGTRMYETKRQASLRLLEKKDAKLLQLNTVINEEIKPKLDHLREQRERYFEFQRAEREVDNLRNLFDAYKYLFCKKSVQSAQESLEAEEEYVREIQGKIAANKTAITTTEEEIQEMSALMEKSKGGKLEKLEAELKKKSKIEAEASALEKGAQQAIVTEEKKKTALEKHLIEDEKAVLAKKKELEKVEKLFQKLKEDDATDTEAFTLSQRKYEAVSAGMEVNDAGEAETLQDQLMDKQQESAAATREITQSQLHIAHFESQLKDKQKEGNNVSDYQTDKILAEKLEKDVYRLETALNKTNFSETRMGELDQQRRTLTNEVRNLDERIQRFEDRYPMVNFRYRDPETNFNRNLVKGSICKLFNVINKTFCTALETAAGGRLFNVVVNSEETGKKLLQRGNLRNRSTFIPLNKIQSQRIPNQVIQLAQSIVGKDNVKLALSLIQYDPQLEKAMVFVFGNVLICTDLNVARKIGFHKNIMRKCVTLDGDVVNPAGVLSGGAAKQGGSILIQIDEITKCEEESINKRRELVVIEDEMRKMSVNKDQYKKLKHDYEINQHELVLVTQRMQNTSFCQQQREVETLKQNIADLNERIKVCKEVEKRNAIKIKELQTKMKDTKGYRERQLKEAESEMKRLKLKSDESRQKWKEREQEFATLQLEFVELTNGLNTLKQAIITSEEHIIELNRNYQALQEATRKAQEEFDAVENLIKEEKGAIADKNKDVQKKVQYKEKLLNDISEFQLELKAKDHEIKKLQEELLQTQSNEEELSKKVKKSKYLQEAEKLTANEAGELSNNIKKNEEKRAKLGRTVNPKAHSLYESEERQYQELVKRKRQVEGDKRKILEVIADLDKKKEQAILLAHGQVTKDFGSIFSTLLPGANAKLEPPAGQSVLEGIEVKVNLGGVWKESLLELSGGQRSLVALSLILAMLLFKPAPLYILDEVDAALDLSHTQNIGNMLKLHFKQSQFIIVSLKDGMFNNANVLYKTKFVDGMSQVTRTVNRGR